MGTNADEIQNKGALYHNLFGTGTYRLVWSNQFERISRRTILHVVH